ncbi:sensor histidine kinase [Fusibacter ferrireducens]|uniref:histidine kinase n=1 Tax=Fusibacter ferrireducens TaxID=2785058 RepID=A0ABR9ZQE0_9FIRM|nr:HAMP domain-containing sensor histidine kinase [Fusibacter ferrireducens]MBF4692667.1 HAMP domain-containing histidine kinase [Fusibacter ferrireducens]
MNHLLDGYINLKGTDMKSHSLRRKAIVTFLVSSIVFIVLITLASRIYIDYVTSTFIENREFSNDFISGEFSKIIRFYVEKDPDKLVSSDILTLYSSLEDKMKMTIVYNDDVIYGRSFYIEYLENEVQMKDRVEIFTTEIEGKNMILIQQRPVLGDDGEDDRKGIPIPFRRVDQFATFSFVGYLIVLIVIFMFFINRILKPLEDVKLAAHEIKKGNLDFKIEYTKKDEIGDVFDAIEEMRNELKEASDLRMQYEKNRNELLSNITHDLKTPITSIKGYVEGIIDGVADTPEKIQKYAKTIYKHSVDMDALINDLFLMSKLDVDQMVFNFERFDLSEFLTDCYEDFYFDLSSHDIKIQYDHVANEPMIIEGDRQTLKRAVINLIQNSIHHLDKENKWIHLTLSSEDGNAIIKIRDNGKGIPESEIKAIFKRFYRIDDSRSSGYGGSGIGLSIVEKIIEKHRGNVIAKSEFGEWTEMIITIPIVE